MGPKVEVDLFDWKRLTNAVAQMQGHTFYCEDDEGVLRRWHPPRPARKESASSTPDSNPLKEVVEKQRRALNQCRLALDGMVSVQSAIDAIDELGGT